MKRGALITILGVAGTFGLFAIGFLSLRQLHFERGVMVPTTAYVAGYDESRFLTITNGLSKENVLKIMGSPPREFEIEGINFLAYSDIGHYTSRWQKAYNQRWIATGKSNSVIYVFMRTITTENDPCYPVLSERRDSDCVWRYYRTREFMDK